MAAVAEAAQRGGKHLLSICTHALVPRRSRRKLQQRIGHRMCLTPRLQRRVAVGRTGRRCTGDEIQCTHYGLVYSKHPERALHLRLRSRPSGAAVEMSRRSKARIG